jgi:acetoin utilization protein AcuB
MFVSLWMTRHPVTISPDTTISQAAKEMLVHGFRRLLVTEPDPGGPKLVGMVTARDVSLASPPDANPFSEHPAAEEIARPVSEIMSRALLTTAPSTPIEDAARIMRERKVGALPVVYASRLEGIITESDICRALIEIVGAREGGVRVTFDIGEDEDIVALVAEITKKHGARVASLLTMEQHEGRRLAVARVIGAESEAVADAISEAGHRVVSVIGPS